MAFPRLFRWLDERLDLQPLLRFAAAKTVPLHTFKVWYYLGGVTLFLFVIQIASGLMLLLYYRPSAAEAYESVQFIVAQVEFGWLVRNIHAWSANLLMAFALAHLFSVFLLKSYRKPREMTWITGVLLLFVVLGLGFSGYLLPWNTRAFFATRVGTSLAGSIPFVGDLLLRFLRGGTEVSGATLVRFYAFHVAILPAAATMLVAIHLLLIQRQGMSVPIPIERKQHPGVRLPRMPFFPNYVIRDVMAWLVTLALLAALAALSPWELGQKADPFAPAPAEIRPEWYFVAMFQTLRLLPGRLLGLEGEVAGVLLFGATALFLLSVPFLDRAASRGQPSLVFTAVAWLLLAYLLVMTAAGYMT